jgi:hypothetical protein
MYYRKHTIRRMQGIKFGRQVAMAACLAALLLALPRLAFAQEETPPPSTPSSPSTGSTPSDTQTDSQSDTQSGSQPDSQSETPPDSPTPPITTSLETGETLTGGNGSGSVQAMHEGVVASILHHGHLSLVSFSSFYVYDSNASFTAVAQPATAFAFQGLLFYSIGSGRSALHLQYRPYALISNGSLQQDFLASSLDVHTYRFLNDRWLINFDDRFQYAPAHGRLIDPTINPDLGSGIISRGPFLATDQTSLYNSATVGLSDRLNAEDTITFRGQYQYIDMWNSTSTSNSSGTVPPTPTLFEQENIIGGGVTWQHQLHPEQRFGIIYTYDYQTIGGINKQAVYNSLFLDYTQRFGRSLLFHGNFGPSMQIRNDAPTYYTYVGTAEILKSFHTSFVALSYIRNYDYSGVVSNSYNTRYDGSYTRQLSHRWDMSVGIGYLQQNFHGSSDLDAREIWGRVGYGFTERLSGFVSVLTAAAAGSAQPYASRFMVTAGIRWGYRPDYEGQSPP